jgi:hypothetical protein
MAKKIDDMSMVELFAKFYSQSLSAAAYIQQALIGASCTLARSVEAGSAPDVSEFQAMVSFMEAKDPNVKLVQTNSILFWMKDIAGLRISNIGKDEASIVRPSREDGFHNAEWLSKVRASSTWSEYGKKKQDPKPVVDPTDQVARQMATYVAMGGMDLPTLEIGMPAIFPKVRALLKNPEFMDKIEARKTELDKRGMEYVKVI